MRFNHLNVSVGIIANFQFVHMFKSRCKWWNIYCSKSRDSLIVQYTLKGLKWLVFTWTLWFHCVDISPPSSPMDLERGRLWGKSFCVKAFEYLFFMISIPSAEVQSVREQRKGKGGIITLMMRWHRTYFGEHFWFFTHFPKLRQIYPEAITVFHKLVRWIMVVMTGSSVNQTW